MVNWFMIGLFCVLMVAMFSEGWEAIINPNVLIGMIVFFGICVVQMIQSGVKKPLFVPAKDADEGCGLMLFVPFVAFLLYVLYCVLAGKVK